MSDATRAAAPVVGPRVHPVVWGVLALLLLGLGIVAVRLLVASGLFSGGELSDAEVQSVWGFLGATLAAVVTLIGTVLAWQQQERTHALAAAAAVQQELARQEQVRATQEQRRLDQEAEQRLQIEATAQMLAQLQGDDGGHTSGAVVAGAIAGLLELAGGTTGVRVLRVLWREGRVDAETAVRVINQVLVRAEEERRATSPSTRRSMSDDEVYAAAELLALYATQVLPPEEDEGRSWINWPSIFGRDPERTGSFEEWPGTLPQRVKFALVVFVARAVSSRSMHWWNQTGAAQPLETLWTAMHDEDHVVAELASAVVRRLVACGFLADTGFPPSYVADLDEKAQAVLGEKEDCDLFVGWVVHLLDELGGHPAFTPVPERPPRAPDWAIKRS